MPIRTHYVEIEGLTEFVRRLHGLRDRELARRVTLVLTRALRSEVVPAMKVAAPVSPQGMRGEYPHRSGTLRRSIGVRAIRKRHHEIVALKVGPRTTKGDPSTRAWYARFVVRGTRPHIISARHLSSGQVRRINQGRGAVALAFGGIVRAAVRHPGARRNPRFIHAGRGRTAAVQRQLIEELLKPHAGRS